MKRSIGQVVKTIGAAAVVLSAVKVTAAMPQRIAISSEYVSANVSREMLDSLAAEAEERLTPWRQTGARKTISMTEPLADPQFFNMSLGRVRVSITWRSQYSGQTGTAYALPQEDRFAFFYFTDPNNPEVFVKVLDFGSPSPFLVFWAGLSDFEYTVTFQSLCTGQSVVATKPAGSTAGGLNNTTLTWCAGLAAPYVAPVGVSSLNGLTGPVNLAAGSNIAVTPSGSNTLTISASGGQGGGITSITAGAGLTGGGSAGNVTVGIAPAGVTANELASNAVTTPKIAAGAVTSTALASNAAVKSLNTLAGDVTLVQGSNVTITPSGNTLTIAAAAGGLTLPYTATANSPGTLFNATNSGAGNGLRGENSTYGNFGYLGTDISGVVGESTNYAAVYGWNHSSGHVGYLGDPNHGVYGKHNGSGNYGSLGEPGYGARGTSTTGTGVYGTSSSGYGVYGSSSSAAGVIGYLASQSLDRAGVLGRTGYVVASQAGYFAAGVRGEGKYGVLGVTTENSGVLGVYNNSGGSQISAGAIGFAQGYGLYAWGKIGATGTKSFVEPHPTDPSKVIRYVALEGNEAGTYFRGTTRIVNGTAVILVPETFKIVTDDEGLTIQVTPVGAPAMVWVESQDLDQIVLRSDKNVTVHYLVQGLRRAYKDWQVVADGIEYKPNSSQETMPAYLSEEAKKRLVQNGTYNPDGTVNMGTAERLGWAQQWREAERLQQQSILRTAEEPLKAPQK